MEAWVSMKRISILLSVSSLENSQHRLLLFNYVKETDNDDDMVPGFAPQNAESPVLLDLAYSHMCFTYSSGAQESDNCLVPEADIFQLGPLQWDIRLHAGCLLGIIGPVACGKTTLLLSLLGELTSHFVGDTATNTLSVNKSSYLPTFSYCPQVPVMHNGNVQFNIIFGSPFDKNRYDEVVEGCGLLPDVSRYSVSCFYYYYYYYYFIVDS
jgi:hypothetical protein